MRYIFGLILFVLCASGCYYDHADLVYPQTACNLTGVTYSVSVKAILNSNCYSCHSGNAAAGGGIALDNYNAVKVYVTNGQLMNSINHTGGIPGMPLSGSQLGSCEIQTIQAWINSGTPNN
jgi:mono/diheme cytochrome c family protein